MEPTHPAPPEPGAALGGSLLDPSGQPRIVLGGGTLVWTLANTLAGEGMNLVATPFPGGGVGPEQHHFAFTFVPGALAAAPAVQGWEVAVETDARGAIATVYLAWNGPGPLEIPSGASARAAWTYTAAVREDAESSAVAVTLVAGTGVALGGKTAAGLRFGPWRMTLAAAPALSPPPIAVDFVGRRAVLNDGHTPNAFTFALTSLAPAELPLAPRDGDAPPTVLTAWFDAAPDDADQPYPWALARVQDLASAAVTLTPPSAAWQVAAVVAGPRHLVPGNPQWTLTVAAPLSLEPQSPLLFTFRGIVTGLEPGVTRMYLRVRDLPGHADGILVAELEKSPVAYGRARGDGMYLSAGTPAGPTPPAPDYGSGLFVRQHGAGPAATLSGGAGLLVRPAEGPAARLDGALRVTAGGADIQGGASIAGAATLDGPATVDGALTANGPAAMNGGLTVNGACALEGELVVGGPATVNGTAVVDGATVLNGPVRIDSDQPGPALQAGGQTVLDALQVNAAVTLGPWTLTQLGDGLRFTGPGGTTIDLAASGIWFNGRRALCHDDPCWIARTNSGAFLNGTVSGDKHHGPGWDKWAYWMNGGDSDSNLTIGYGHPWP